MKKIKFTWFHKLKPLYIQAFVFLHVVFAWKLEYFAGVTYTLPTWFWGCSLDVTAMEGKCACQFFFHIFSTSDRTCRAHAWHASHVHKACKSEALKACVRFSGFHPTSALKHTYAPPTSCRIYQLNFLIAYVWCSNMAGSSYDTNFHLTLNLYFKTYVSPNSVQDWPANLQSFLWFMRLFKPPQNAGHVKVEENVRVDVTELLVNVGQYFTYYIVNRWHPVWEKATFGTLSNHLNFE